MAPKHSFFANGNRKHDLLTALLLSFLFTLSYGLLTPLEIILSNQKEFLISFWTIAGKILLPVAAVFCAVLVVQAISALIGHRAFRVVSSLLLGLTLAWYCQELFMNGKVIHGINGTNVGDISKKMQTANAYFHVVVICLPMLVTLFRFVLEDDPKRKASDHGESERKPSFLAQNIVAVIFVGVAVMKLTGFASAFISNSPAKYKENYMTNNSHASMFYSLEPTAVYSKENNVVVFIVDRFDSFWCDTFLEAYPEMEEKLDGFTFYQNNLSQYTNTFPSICSMITHLEYDGSPGNEYLSRAWSNRHTLSVLKEHDYHINLLLDSTTTYGSPARIEPYCDNTLPMHDMQYEVNTDVVRRIVYSFLYTRVMPYCLKDVHADALRLTTELKYLELHYEGDEAFKAGATNLEGDCAIYDFASKAKFEASSAQNVFTMIHLFGAHCSNAELIQTTGTKECSDEIITTIRANFETILTYMEQAKALGVYDNTTYIILGDHGMAPEELWNDDRELTAPIVTALMLKPANAPHGSLIYDRYTTLSNSMLAASVLQAAGIDHQEFGLSYQDVIESGQTVPRVLNSYAWSGDTNVSLLDQFLVEGDARDFANWKKQN